MIERLSRVALLGSAWVLYLLFGLSIPASLARGTGEEAGPDAEHGSAGRWPLALTLGILAAAGVAAAFVSDWFVAGLQPAMDAAHISEAFAGLVVVAIAGNAVENVVGIQLAARNETDYALSVILQSPLQIALVLAPVLVLIAPLIGATAAYGVALALRADPSDAGLRSAYAELLAARPTAIDLKWALDEMTKAVRTLAPRRRAEVAYAVTHENALHVEDVLVRRTRLFMEAGDSGADAAAEVSAIMGRLLGWSRRRRAAEARRYLDLVESEQPALALAAAR